MLLLFIAILLDIYVNLTGNKFITITESYISSIYSSITTVAILCISLIALISDKLEKTYYGYKLKEIILFENSPLNFKGYFTLSFSGLILATFLFFTGYKFSCANTITALLIAEICLEFLMAKNIFEIITNETSCYEIVESYIKNNKVRNGEESQEKYEREITRLFHSLYSFVETQNHKKIEKVIELIVLLNEKNKNLIENNEVYQILLNQLREIVTPLADNFGYNQMVKDIILLSKQTRTDKGKEDLYLIPIENMRFWDDKALLKNNYFNQIIKIRYINEYHNNEITEKEVEFILYIYFVSLINNQLCTEKVRNQLIFNYFNNISRFYWKKSDDSLLSSDSTALLTIFIEYVLKNDNHKEKEYIYKLILKNVYLNNQSYIGNIFPSTVSMMLQVFYSYIYLEKELLNESYRKSLKDLFVSTISDKTNNQFKFSDIIRDHIKNIVPAIAKRIEKKDKIEESFEFFPSYLTVKTTIWTNKFNVEFLLMLYLIYYNKLLTISFFDLFDEWDKVRGEVAKVIWSKFDKATHKINEEFHDRCKEFAQLLNCNYLINDEAEKELFNLINEEKKEINKKIEIPQKCDINNISINLYSLIEEEKIYGWDKEYTEGTKTHTFKFSYIEENKWIEEDLTTQKLKNAIIDAVQYSIISDAKKVSIELNDKLDLTELSRFANNYSARNFKFDEYLTYNQCKGVIPLIKNIEDKMNYIDTAEIRIPILFNHDNFRFNVQIININYLDLSDDDCVEYLREFKSYNGFYDVNGATYPKDEAIQTIKKQYKEEIFEFKLILSFNKDDILYIDFKH